MLVLMRSPVCSRTGGTVGQPPEEPVGSGVSGPLGSHDGAAAGNTSNLLKIDRRDNAPDGAVMMVNGWPA